MPPERQSRTSRPLRMLRSRVVQQRIRERFGLCDSTQRGGQRRRGGRNFWWRALVQRTEGARRSWRGQQRRGVGRRIPHHLPKHAHTRSRHSMADGGAALIRLMVFNVYLVFLGFVYSLGIFFLVSFSMFGLFL